MTASTHGSTTTQKVLQPEVWDLRTGASEMSPWLSASSCSEYRILSIILAFVGRMALRMYAQGFAQGPLVPIFILTGMSKASSTRQSDDG